MASSKFTRRFRIQPVNALTAPGPECQHGRLLAYLEWQWNDGRPWPAGRQTVELTVVSDGFAAYQFPDRPPRDHEILNCQVTDDLGLKDALVLNTSIFNAGNEEQLGELRFTYDPLPTNTDRQSLGWPDPSLNWFAARLALT